MITSPTPVFRAGFFRYWSGGLPTKQSAEETAYTATSIDIGLDRSAELGMCQLSIVVGISRTEDPEISASAKEKYTANVVMQDLAAFFLTL